MSSNIFANVHMTGNCVVAGAVTAANDFMFRNKLINGNMGIWQRATTGTATAASAYTTADRWCGALGTSGLTLTQSATVPAGAGFNYSLQVATSTATASTPLIEQRIEQVNVSELVNGSTVTVSFWASQTSGTLMPLSVSLLYPTVKDVFSTQTLAVASAIATPTLTSTMTYYNVTFVLNTGSVATNGLSLRFTSGATASACTFLITGVQLERGPTGTRFEFRPYAIELPLCQRYYYQIKPTAPFGLFGSGISSSTTAAEIMITYPVTLRSNTVTLTNSTVGNFQWWAIGVITQLLATMSLATIGDGQGFVTSRLGVTYATAGAAGQPGFLRTSLNTANSEYLGFSCEL